MPNYKCSPSRNSVSFACCCFYIHLYILLDNSWLLQLRVVSPMPLARARQLSRGSNYTSQLLQHIYTAQFSRLRTSDSGYRCIFMIIIMSFDQNFLREIPDLSSHWFRPSFRSLQIIDSRLSISTVPYTRVS